MSSQNNGSNAVSFGLGTLIGVGAGVFLSTKKGRKMVKQAWKQVEPYLDDAVDTVKDEFEEVKGKAKLKVDELKVRAEDLRQKADDTLQDFESRTEDLKDRAEVFKSKAEDEVDRKISQIKDLADEKLPLSIKKPVKRTFFKGV
jgi:gas vesicle protein